MSIYQQWNEGKIENFGSFHTTLLQAYRLASEDNRRKLELGFPDWFLDKEPDNSHIETKKSSALSFLNHSQA